MKRFLSLMALTSLLLVATAVTADASMTIGVDYADDYDSQDAEPWTTDALNKTNAVWNSHGSGTLGRILFSKFNGASGSYDYKFDQSGLARRASVTGSFYRADGKFTFYRSYNGVTWYPVYSYDGPAGAKTDQDLGGVTGFADEDVYVRLEVSNMSAASGYVYDFGLVWAPVAYADSYVGSTAFQNDAIDVSNTSWISGFSGAMKIEDSSWSGSDGEAVGGYTYKLTGLSGEVTVDSNLYRGRNSGIRVMTSADNSTWTTQVDNYSAGGYNGGDGLYDFTMNVTAGDDLYVRYEVYDNPYGSFTDAPMGYVKDVTIVPEPMTLSLLGLGLFAGVLRRFK